MTTVLRKLLVVAIIVAVLGLANVHELTRWLMQHGVIEAADRVEAYCLNGTTVAIVVALLILLRSDRRVPRYPPPWPEDREGYPAHRPPRRWE